MQSVFGTINLNVLDFTIDEGESNIKEEKVIPAFNGGCISRYIGNGYSAKKITLASYGTLTDISNLIAAQQNKTSATLTLCLITVQIYTGTCHLTKITYNGFKGSDEIYFKLDFAEVVE